MTRSGRSRLLRRAVSYTATSDGDLVATLHPDRELLAAGEATLYRRLAALTDATADALVATASRFGPLGPTGQQRVANPALYLWALDEAARTQVAAVAELRRWLATGGQTLIPARLASAATFVRAFAQADPELTAIYQLVSDGLAAPDQAPDDAERLRRYQAGLEAALDVPLETAREWIANPTALVSIPVHPRHRSRLGSAARLVQGLYAETARNGGFSAGIGSQGLGQFAAEVSPYALAPLFGLDDDESLARWRDAIAELADWARAVRNLRNLRAGSRSARPPDLSVLYSRAAIPPELARPDEGQLDAPQLAAKLHGLLVLRLNQVGAWPYPAGRIVGAFGRALWSLWRPITDSAPPRTCAWRDGCTELLGPTAHGNRRYCPFHVREADRLRAAHVRERARSSPKPAHGEPSFIL